MCEAPNRVSGPCFPNFMVCCHSNTLGFFIVPDIMVLALQFKIILVHPPFRNRLMFQPHSAASSPSFSSSLSSSIDSRLPSLCLSLSFPLPSLHLSFLFASHIYFSIKKQIIFCFKNSIP